MISAVSLGSTYLYRNPVVNRVQRFVLVNWQVLFLGLVGVVLVGTLAYKCRHVVSSEGIDELAASRGADGTPSKVNAKSTDREVDIVFSEVVATSTDSEVIHEVSSEGVAKPTDREVIEAVMCLDSERIRKCIKEGGNVKATGPGNISPLMIVIVNACLFYERAKAAFDTLLELGFDPSVQDKDGLTALHYAILFSGGMGGKNAAHFVTGLLNKKAKYNLKDSLGVSAKDLAREELGFLRIAFEDAGVKFDDELANLSDDEEMQFKDGSVESNVEKEEVEWC